MRGKHSYVSIFIYSFNQCLHHGFIQAKNLEKDAWFYPQYNIQISLRVTEKDGVYTMTDYFGNGWERGVTYRMDEEFEVFVNDNYFHRSDDGLIL